LKSPGSEPEERGEAICSKREEKEFIGKAE
jgi:hypothetical protein